MKAPPVQVAATVEVPVKRSSTPITLSPGVPGPPWVADHEMVVCVTSCGIPAPVIVQIARGLRASLTSARTVPVEPCMTSRASCVAGAPVQLACMAAQAGTAAGLAGGGVGLAGGLGVSVGVGEGLGLELELGEGLAEELE
jgi:hypothetical protein